MKYLLLLSCLFFIPIDAKELSSNRNCLKKDLTITFWGGQMVDSDILDAFFLGGEIPSSRKEYLTGFGIQKEILKKNKNYFIYEINYLRHTGKDQRKGGLSEIFTSFGIYKQINQNFKIGILEGISYLNNTSLYEETFREKNNKLLNYLGFEVERKINNRLFLTGRIHHRSGAFGLFGGVKDGSNGYLLGFRYLINSKNEKNINSCKIAN